ncbi:serpin B5-like [Contarinia nasturtii]|uniref:serpin B5-like n=1 Tax=Contarinia nasturtii TaxID=265458 RepID=UPI0012D42A73|nr:serpin B5-like [Contarinia nasturtii]
MALGLTENKADTMDAYKLDKSAQVNRIQNQTIEFTSHTRLYFPQNINIKNSTKELLNEHIEQLNFVEESDQCRSYINQFIANATNNHYENAFNSDSITSETLFAFIYAVYFKGEFVEKFPNFYTLKSIFYNQNRKPTHVEMMAMNLLDIEEVEYGKIYDLNTEVLKLPFKNEGISMFILLPVATSQSIENLLANLTPEILFNVFCGTYNIHSANWYGLHFSFPKFELDKSSEIIPALQHMGIRTLFNDSANLGDFGEFDFSAKMTKSKFNAFAQMAKIEIDQELTITPEQHRKTHPISPRR